MLKPNTTSAGAYFGFFNSTRQGWRPWSSMAVRIGELRSPEPPLSDSHVDYMTGSWRAGGFSTLLLPADGKPHAWEMAYDPDATVPAEWADAKLRDSLQGEGRHPEDKILERVKLDEPGVTAEQLRKRLDTAADLGLIGFHTRRGTGWEIRREPEKVKGKITFRFDDSPVIPYFLDAEHRAQAVEMDRFGIFNFQIPGDATEFYLSDLTVNGHKIDLSSDPAWEGSGNQVTFAERDFHAKHNFGYSQSNWAGEKLGEIGGTFWRTEAVDPLHGGGTGPGCGRAGASDGRAG